MGSGDKVSFSRHVSIQAVHKSAARPPYFLALQIIQSCKQKLPV